MGREGLMGGMDIRLMVKGYYGRIALRFGEGNVYESGDPRYIVLRPCEELTPGSFYETGLEFAFKRTDLKRGWWKNLH